MSGVNKVILVGNLGKDPEVRHLESGVAVASFSIATSETYKDKNTGERITNTEWHNIVLWRGLAEVAEKYLKKGNQIYVEGKLKTRKWTDAEGIERRTTDVVADNMTMLGGRSNKTDSYQPPVPSEKDIPQHTDSKSASVAEPSMNEEDDLPF